LFCELSLRPKAGGSGITSMEEQDNLIQRVDKDIWDWQVIQRSFKQ
jgi:hypothetical protein